MQIELIQGDITELDVDVIVNAANKSLLGGGGVDGAIHKAGGPSILEECEIIRRRQGGCKPGQAVITTAGDMPSKKVVHTVGPIWSGGDSEERTILSNCYSNSFKLADDEKFESIAFPNISTGVYGFPKADAAKIAISEIQSFVPRNLEKVIFVCFDEENYNYYKSILK